MGLFRKNLFQEILQIQFVEQSLAHIRRDLFRRALILVELDGFSHRVDNNTAVFAIL
jgi:hypothetical protein